MKKLTVILMVLVIGIAIGSMLDLFFHDTRGVVILHNMSGEPVCNATVIVRDAAMTFGKIADGEYAFQSYLMGSDADYSVWITFESGKQVSLSNVGYVTNGLNSCDLFEVHKEDVLYTNIQEVNR